MLALGAGASLLDPPIPPRRPVLHESPPPPRTIRLLIVAIALAIAVIGLILAAPTRGRAAGDATPPAPPTMVPTPIGAPPGPPTPASTAPSATATATAVTSPRAIFSLDAARVSPVNDKGDRKGLTKARSGQTVWLMMYFTIKYVPHPTSRVTAYRLSYGGKTIYHASYSGRISSSDTGRFSRYVPVKLGATLAPGRYHFAAQLKIGSKSEKRWWSFDLVTK